jgi:hypothetical protein
MKPKRTAIGSEALTIAADDIFTNRAELLQRFQAQLATVSAELAADTAA